MHINWAERESKLANILREAKETSTGYDCLLPISGGKDSFFQAHVLTKVYGLRPLAVTFSHNWYSETGYFNLQLCLKTFDLDHIQFTPSRGKVNQLARQSLFEIGDSCWHCHSGVGAFPLRIAISFGIRLIIWGESICESSGRATYNDPVHEYDKDYFLKVSAKKSYEEMGKVSGIDPRNLDEHRLPSRKEIEDSGIRGIHLGDYIFWDEERQTEFIKEQYKWKETAMEGAIKGYKSAECIMAGVHDYMCYLKRGFGRATMQASVDVRNGLMTREEAMIVAKEFESVRPQALDYYLNICGLEEDEFRAAIQTHQSLGRDKSIELEPSIDSNHIEELVPFSEQVILKNLQSNDRRLTANDKASLESDYWY